MKMKDFFKSKKTWLNIWVVVLVFAVVAVVAWGCEHGSNPLHMGVSDNIEQIDLDTIYLKSSDVEVNFADVILSEHRETRKLIVSTQRGTVKTELTDRLIKQLDFNFLKKTQSVSYTGTGYFVVDLDNLTTANVIEDKDRKTVTIRIDHAYLQAIEINPDDIIIDDVKEGLLAQGDIELSVKDYNVIEKELRTRLEEKFDTASNGQAADYLALKMVQNIYEPIVKAIDWRYDVIVEFV